MRKIIFISLAVIMLFIAAFTFSCGGKSEAADYTFDIQRLALMLTADIPFDDELIRLEDDAVSLMYNFGGINTVVYAGSGATPEVIIITECGDGEADEAVGKMKKYIADQITLFTDYNASQLPKLQTAVCEAFGRYAICVVGPDSAAARTVIENQAKE